MTQYAVLQQADDGRFDMVGVYDAPSGDAASKASLEARELETGVCAPVPLSSWKPARHTARRTWTTEPVEVGGVPAEGGQGTLDGAGGDPPPAAADGAATPPQGDDDLVLT